MGPRCRHGDAVRQATRTRYGISEPLNRTCIGLERLFSNVIMDSTYNIYLHFDYTNAPDDGSATLRSVVC
jgi:hypothetical protein